MGANNSTLARPARANVYDDAPLLVRQPGRDGVWPKFARRDGVAPRYSKDVEKPPAFGMVANSVSKRVRDRVDSIIEQIEKSKVTQLLYAKATNRKHTPEGIFSKNKKVKTLKKIYDEKGNTLIQDDEFAIQRVESVAMAKGIYIGVIWLIEVARHDEKEGNPKEILNNIRGSFGHGFMAGIYKEDGGVTYGKEDVVQSVVEEYGIKKIENSRRYFHSDFTGRRPDNSERVVGMLNELRKIFKNKYLELVYDSTGTVLDKKRVEDVLQQQEARMAEQQGCCCVIS